VRAAQRWPSCAPLATSIDRGKRRHETALKTNVRLRDAPAASPAGRVGRRVNRNAAHLAIRVYPGLSERHCNAIFGLLKRGVKAVNLSSCQQLPRLMKYLLVNRGRVYCTIASITRFCNRMPFRLLTSLIFNFKSGPYFNIYLQRTFIVI